MIIEKTQEHTEFFSSIVQSYRNPFAVQKKDHNWQTKRRFVSDYDIQRHLQQTHAIGLNAANYPLFINFDIDHPKTQEKLVWDLLDRLGISESQRLIVTTPSFVTEGSYRLYIRPTYNFRPASFSLLKRFIIDKFSYLCEIYPQEKRIERLPFSFKSEVIKDDILLSFLTLQEKLNLFSKIDCWEIDFDAIAAAAPTWEDKKKSKKDNIQDEAEINLTDEEAEYLEIKNLQTTEEVEDLLKNGLQAKGTRNRAQFEILYSFFLSGLLKEQAIKQTRTWIKSHSNGFSGAVIKQNWRLISAEITRQADKIWNDYRRTISKAAQEVSFISTVQDLKLAAELFNGDIVKQKQLFNLLAYYRPKAKHEFIFISNKNWRKHIASYKTYKELQSILEEKGILEADRRFDINNYSQKFRLNLNLQGDIIRENDYSISNYYEAWKTAYNNDLRAIRAITGIKRTTFFENFGKLKG